MARKLTLLLDEEDFRDIQKAITERQLIRVLPDSTDPGANLLGRLIAEVCRSYLDYKYEDKE